MPRYEYSDVLRQGWRRILDSGKLTQILTEATRKATPLIPLRPNAVDPFTRKNTGDNTERYIPLIGWEVGNGKSLEITAATKAYGSENMCVLNMLTPIGECARA